MIATIIAFAEKNHSDHNYGNHSPAIVAIAVPMIAEMRNISISKSLQSLESGFHMINVIAELFFLQ